MKKIRESDQEILTPEQVIRVRNDLMEMWEGLPDSDDKDPGMMGWLYEFYREVLQAIAQKKCREPGRCAEEAVKIDELIWPSRKEKLPTSLKCPDCGHSWEDHSSGRCAFVKGKLPKHLGGILYCECDRQPPMFLTTASKQGR